MSLFPVVGYMGGKRRMLKSIRSYLDPSDISVYVEPFVGMGAVYLDLRDRGFRGHAVLADANQCVADFWRYVHSPVMGVELHEAAAALSAWPATPAGFSSMMAAAVQAGPGRIARFLWLTNYSFSNSPPTYTDDGWKLPRGCTTKLKSAAKWNKTFPWLPCVARLNTILDAVAGMRCDVLDDGLPLLCAATLTDTIYADPPYVSKAKYDGVGERTALDYIEPVMSARGRVLLSEMELVPLPQGWSMEEVGLLSRVSGNNVGSAKTRTERLYHTGF